MKVVSFQRIFMTSLVLTVLAAGCSPKQFSNSGDNPGVASSGNGDPSGGDGGGTGTDPSGGDGGGTGTDPSGGGGGDDGAGTTIPEGPGSTDTLPKLSFVRYVCELGTLCRLDMKLTPKPVAKLEIYWKTDDTLAKTNTTRYSQPGIDYVSKSDMTTFQAGQDLVMVYVQSISQGSGGKEIPILLTDCYYGGKRVSCKGLVTP